MNRFAIQSLSRNIAFQHLHPFWDFENKDWLDHGALSEGCSVRFVPPKESKRTFFDHYEVRIAERKEVRQDCRVPWFLQCTDLEGISQEQMDFEPTVLPSALRKKRRLDQSSRREKKRTRVPLSTKMWFLLPTKMKKIANGSILLVAWFFLEASCRTDKSDGVFFLGTCSAWKIDASIYWDDWTRCFYSRDKRLFCLSGTTKSCVYWFHVSCSSHRRHDFFSTRFVSISYTWISRFWWSCREWVFLWKPTVFSAR